MCSNITYSDGQNSMCIVLGFSFLFASFKDLSSVSAPNCRYVTQPVLPLEQQTGSASAQWNLTMLKVTYWNSSEHLPLAASGIYIPIASTRIFHTSKLQFPLFCHWSCSFPMTKARFLPKQCELTLTACKLQKCLEWWNLFCHEEEKASLLSTEICDEFMQMSSGPLTTFVWQLDHLRF